MLGKKNNPTHLSSSAPVRYSVVHRICPLCRCHRQQIVQDWRLQLEIPLKFCLNYILLLLQKNSISIYSQNYTTLAL